MDRYNNVSERRGRRRRRRRRRRDFLSVLTAVLA
jgi:hypothetical protein